MRAINSSVVLLAEAHGVDGSSGSLSDEMLEFGKDLFDGVQVLLLQHRIRHEKPGRLHVEAANCASLWIADMSRASMTPTLSAKISSPVLSTTPQRSPSPSKPKPTSALVLEHRVADRVQHLHVFGVRIVFREGVVKLGVERDHFAADRLHHVRCERAGVPLPQEQRPSACA